jgi:glycoside/pentoside/hexuronide:cation symporter, GPH family
MTDPSPRDPGRPVSREPTVVELLCYGLPALPLALLTLPFYVIVPGYYASVGVPIALVGTILLAVRLFDAFSDPIAGYLSDRTQARFGRRRTWFAAGIPLTALAAYMVFNPPDQVTWQHLMIWSLALSLGWTIALVPFNAWGAELSPSYDGRNRVTVFREGFAFVGTLAALIIQYVVSEGQSTAVGLERTLDVFALIMVVALPIAALVTLFMVPEPVNRSMRTVSFADGLGYMRNNIPFQRLVLAFLINGLANGFPVTLFILYVSDRLELPEKAGLFLVVYFFAGLVGMPFWLQLAKMTSKHRSWCYAMLLACAAFIFAPFLPPKADALFLAICVLTGFSVGADLVLPASLQADVIDVDTAASGEQRSGIYLAIWGLATKLALALAVGIAFPLLAASGYDPGAEIRTEVGLKVLALLYAAAPVCLKLAAIAIMWDFPLDGSRQAALRDAIEKRLTP